VPSARPKLLDELIRRPPITLPAALVFVALMLGFGALFVVAFVAGATP
jgi:hypothetical protein